MEKPPFEAATIPLRRFKTPPKGGNVVCRQREREKRQRREREESENIYRIVRFSFEFRMQILIQMFRFFP